MLETEKKYFAHSNLVYYAYFILFIYFIFYWEGGLDRPLNVNLSSITAFKFS